MAPAATGRPRRQIKFDSRAIEECDTTSVRRRRQPPAGASSLNVPMTIVMLGVQQISSEISLKRRLWAPIDTHTPLPQLD